MKLRLSVKSFRQFVGKFLVGLLQLQSTCSYDFALREKIFVWNFHFFIISESDQKNIEFRQSIFGRVVKTAFYVCIRTFWQKLLSFSERYKLLLLSDLQRNFFWILSKLIGEVLKTAIYGPIGYFEQKGFLWKLLRCFCLLWSLSKRYLTICREIFGGVVKTAFWESMPYFSGKTFCLWKKCTCFGSFRYWANKFRPLVEKFSAGLRQPLSMCPEDLIYERFFLKENGLIIFSDLELNVLAFCRKSVGEVAKTAFYVPIWMFFFINFFLLKK